MPPCGRDERAGSAAFGGCGAAGGEGWRGGSSTDAGRGCNGASNGAGGAVRWSRTYRPGRRRPNSSSNRSSSRSNRQSSRLATASQKKKWIRTKAVGRRWSPPPRRCRHLRPLPTLIRRKNWSAASRQGVPMYKKDGQKAAGRPRRAATCGGGGVDPPPPPGCRCPHPAGRQSRARRAGQAGGEGGPARWRRGGKKGRRRGQLSTPPVPAPARPSPPKTRLC